jgi:putative colanic acid biosynthesis glycosyltransferase
MQGTKNGRKFGEFYQRSSLMPAPLFTLITITMNNLAGLKKTAASVLEQTCTDFEWVIIDGASKDGTIEFLASLPRQENFLQTSEPDRGLYDAMNKGIERAKGDYLLFLNAGDCLAEATTLERIKTRLGKSSPDFIYGDSWEGTEEHKNFKRAKPHHTIRNGLFTHHQAMLYNRLSLGTLRYNLVYKIAADYDLTLKFLTNHPKCLRVDLPICLFERGGVSQRLVTLGRKEQFYIRAQQNAVPLWQNILIYVRQALAHFVRRLCPPLYWWTQSRRH